jgi:hypothetical protein
MTIEQPERPVRSASPPRWAEALLRVLLPADKAETVLGDLLEEYREVVRPSRGALRANTWYVAQVPGFVGRECWVLGGLQGIAFVVRNASDWFAPPEVFYTRSVVTTFTAAVIFLTAGFWTAWHSQSLRIGTVTGLVASGIAAGVSVVGSVVLLAIWHDPLTLGAVARSGGLSEVLTLPLLMIIPATLLAAFGAVAGKLMRAAFAQLYN